MANPNSGKPLHLSKLMKWGHEIGETIMSVSLIFCLVPRMHVVLICMGRGHGPPKNIWDYITWAIHSLPPCTTKQKKPKCIQLDEQKSASLPNLNISMQFCTIYGNI